MKRRVLGILLATALLLAVGATAAACGDGGDELTLEQYFQRLETISNDLEEQGETLGSEFESAFDPETGAATGIDTLQKVLSESASAFRDARNEVESLDPPSEVEAAHSRFVEAARGRADLVDSLADRAAEIESVSDFEELFEELAGPESEVDTQLLDACRGLEALASENSIGVDLNCE